MSDRAAREVIEGTLFDKVTEVNELLDLNMHLYLCNCKWSDTFPQEEGLYWFFGHDYGPRAYLGELPTLCLHTVKVHRVQKGYSYVCDGHFIFSSEAVGVWLPITLPEFPEEIA